MSDDGKTQVLTVLPVREYIQNHDRTGRSDDKLTQSEFLDDILPDNPIDHGFTAEEEVRVKVHNDVNDRIEAMAGRTVSKGDVMALYVLIDALSEGDSETSEEILPIVSELLWGSMEVDYE